MYACLLIVALLVPGETQDKKPITGVAAPTCSTSKARPRLFRHTGCTGAQQTSCTGTKQTACTGTKQATCTGKVTVVRTKSKTRSTSCHGTITNAPAPAIKEQPKKPLSPPVPMAHCSIMELSTTKTVGDRIYRRSVYFEPDKDTK